MELTAKRASVDISTKCQLKCVSCSTSKGIIREGFIGEGFMRFDQFKRFVDMNPEIEEIELSNWGEIFLNPDILDIMKFAFQKGVSLSCANGSNFNHVTEEVLEGLVKYRFKCLNLSIDGASQETYVQYRKNGNFSKVLSNIQLLNQYKHKYNSVYPKLSWQFIIFGHNEHEINMVKDLCDELNMTFNPKMNHSDFSPIINADRVKQDAGLDYATRAEYKEKYGSEYKHPCYQCLHSPQVNWNGEVLGCCVNKWAGLGNVNNKPLKEILNSPIYKYMIKVLFGEVEANDSIPCFSCPNLIKIQKQPLSMDGLKKYSEYVPIALPNNKCPICNRMVEKFQQVGSSFPVIKELSIVGAGDRLQKCPYCKGSDRDRLVYLFLKEHLDVWGAQGQHISILHVAPERCIAEKLINSNLEYLAIDSFEHGYEYDSYITKMNLLDLKCNKETFDIVICNHVLQDIYEDKRAMDEIWRVLKKGGKAILQVPISPVLKKTLEHEGILSEEECAHRYGQRFHKRIYCEKDYIERLQSVGFTVKVIPASRVTSTPQMYSVNINENLFVAEKNDTATK